jgi:hypothetical protein
MHIGYWRESQKERDHEEEEDVSGWIILKWVLERWDGAVWTGLICLRIGTSGGSCEHGNEPSGSYQALITFFQIGRRHTQEDINILNHNASQK